MRLIFLNRFYWPETPATGQLLTDLAEALAAQGHAVTIITSRPGGVAMASEETRRGVRILRVRGTRLARGGIPGKALDFATFYTGALWRLLRGSDRGTTVIALTDPPLIGIGAWLVARLRGARMIHWAQDIYPEIALALTGHRWLRVLRPLRDIAWRRADRCVALGSDMAAVMAAAGVAGERLVMSPNWAPEGLTTYPDDRTNTLRQTWGLDGKFVVAYSGNLGRVHDLAPILAVAETLREESSIAFIFIGDGAQRSSLLAEARRLGLANVAFFPPQPRSQLAESLAVGDVHLVTLLPGCERFVFPSKLYGIAAVGRPMILVGPAGCEVARVVTAHGLGLAAERSDITGLADGIRHLAADPAARARHAAAARRFAASHDATAAAGRWVALLDGMNPGSNAAPGAPAVAKARPNPSRLP